MKLLRILVLLCLMPYSLLAQQITGASTFSQAEIWADSLLETLSTDEKIGQLFMVAAYSNRDSTHQQEITKLITQYHIGGVIFFQGSPLAQTKLLNHYQSVTKIPLWVGMDAEWGIGMRLDSTMSFPYQMTLGAIRDDQLIYQMGQSVGRQFRRMGMHINFAPVLDVNNNAANPVINFRSFGEDPTKVSKKGMAYVSGLQDANVLATGKHFPGHGDTDTDSHKDLPQINHDWDRLKEVELFPFENAMQQGMEGVMVAHLSIPALDSTEHLPSTLSPAIVKSLLRDSLQFSGLVFTDALQMEGITKYFEPGEIEAKALMSDNDVLLFPQDVPKGIAGVKQAMREGKISPALVNEKCRKILVAKYLLEVNARPVALTNMAKELHTVEDEILNRKLHAAALTIIKNDDELLPLKDLENRKIASLNIGFGQTGIFEERLASYTEVDHFAVDQKDISSKQKEILDALSQYDLVLVGVENLSKWPFRNYGITPELDEFLSNVMGANESVLTWWGSPYGLAMISAFDLAKAVIITYQEDELMRDFAGQLLFGGIGATGALPVTLNRNYPAGTGIVTTKTRFSYELPEEAGLDGEYLRKKIDSIALFAIDSGVAPGIQVLVAKDQKVVYQQTYGFHRYDSLEPVKKTDLYDLASVTKITGALPALMQLHDQDVFDIDQPIGTYLPYFSKGNKKDIPLRRILSHNAKLKAWIPYWTTTIKKNGKYRRKTLSHDSSSVYSIRLTDSLYLYKDYKEKIYKMIRKSDLLDDDTYVYSGLSFYLFPEIVSSLTQVDFESYLKSNIYQPLGATSITYNPTRYFSLDDIIPTEVDTFFRKVPLHGVVHDEGAAMMNGVSSNAGLFARTIDLAKIMQMYLNMGSYGGREYISRNTMEKFTFCHYCEEGNRRGLAFDKPVLTNKENGSTAIDASASSFGHSGYTGTFAWADPETGILFIFMSNRVYPTRNNRKLYQLNIRPAMHQVIYDARIE